MEPKLVIHHAVMTHNIWRNTLHENTNYAWNCITQFLMERKIFQIFPNYFLGKGGGGGELTGINLCQCLSLVTQPPARSEAGFRVCELFNFLSSLGVLVTGATGFVATHIIKQLHEKGYKVRGTVRSLSNESKIKHIKELFPDGAVELVETDLTKEDGWARYWCIHLSL